MTVARDQEGRPITCWGGAKLLEYNPSKVYPWVTVTLAQEELRILQAREEEIVDLRPIVAVQIEVAGEMHYNELMQASATE